LALAAARICCADNATFVTAAPPSGIDFVFVNGVLAVDARAVVDGPGGPDGFMAHALPVSRAPGMVLRGPGVSDDHRRSA
jgi:hypothetical protein